MVKRNFALVQSGYLQRRKGSLYRQAHFLPKGAGDPPLLMVQTKDLIISCSNLQSNWTNLYFCTSYVDIRTETHTDMVSLVGMGPCPNIQVTCAKITFLKSDCRFEQLMIRSFVCTIKGGRSPVPFG